MVLAFNDLASSTIENYRKQYTDNIFNTLPLLYWLKEKKRVRMLDGGESIVEPLIYTAGDLGTASGSYSNYDAIDINPVNTLTAAKFDWKQIASTIAISGLEELKNSGEQAMVNLLEAKIMQSEETLKSSLSGMLWSAATPGNSGKNVSGLPWFIDDANTVGGIAVADMASWASPTYDKTAVLAADVDLRAFVRTAYNTASKGGPDKVDVVFSGQTAYEQYEADLLPSVRRTNTKVADAGFSNLEVQGVPWMWDPECPSGTILGINSKYLGLVGHSQRWFKQTPFTEGLTGDMAAVAGGVATTVDARYSLITSVMELTMRNRRRHFKIKNLNF